MKVIGGWGAGMKRKLEIFLSGFAVVFAVAFLLWQYAQTGQRDFIVVTFSFSVVFLVLPVFECCKNPERWKSRRITKPRMILYCIVACTGFLVCVVCLLKTIVVPVFAPITQIVLLAGLKFWSYGSNYFTANNASSQTK